MTALMLAPRAECIKLVPDFAARRGLTVTKPMLRAALPVADEQTQSGLSPVALRNMLALLGMQTRSWRGIASGLEARHFPCLCLTSQGLQLAEAPTDKLRGLFFLSLTNNILPSAPLRRGWSRQLLEKYRPLWRSLLAMSIAVQLVALSVPLLTMVVYDRVAGAAAMTDLVPLGVGLFLIVVGETLLRRLRLGLVSWAAARLDHIVNADIVARLLTLPAAMVEGVSIAAQVARLKSFEAIRDFFSSPLFLNLFELPAALIMLLVVYLIAGPLALVPLMMVGLYTLSFFAIRPTVARRLEAAGIAHANRQELLLETIHEPLTLRADGMASLYATRGSMLTAQAATASRSSARLTDWLEHGATWANGMAGVTTLIWGVERVLDGQLTQGALLAAMLLTWRLLAPLAMFCTTLPRFEQMALAFRQLDQLQAVQGESDGRIRNLPTPRIAGAVEFVNVSLRQNRAAQIGEPILMGLKVAINPGELVAVMGANGVGKSTLLKLVPGLQRPQIGSVRIDGIDIRQFDVAALRNLIAYMPQQPDLFRGSIAGNLRLAKPDATTAQLWAALDSAGAGNDVRVLEGGLAARVGSHDSWRIPPSLAYRISLARLILRDAKIHLIDELPYALMHGDAEETYRRLLLANRGIKTTLFVTHRRDHAALADRIIYLRPGHTPVTVVQRDLQALLAEMER